MLRQLKIRDRLVVMATVPIVTTAVLAVGALAFVGGDDIRPFGIFALVGLVVSVAAAAVIGQSILSSVSEQTSTATAWAAAAKDGPQLDAETNAGANAGPAAPIAPLAETAPPETNTDLESIKAGLRNIVVNLARRSQTLLDRQVDYIDRLESGEEDPDRLEDLFKVDHLATRMRRNAESLLVLANAEPAKRRGGPVEIGDVLRVAMGEVENYQSINLTNVDSAQVGAGTAVDLAHMVAELMENATQFSAPETSVEVTGNFADDDRFAITVADRGMGMDADQLAEANRTLNDPPELSLDMGRSLGFVVVGRLAKRLNADVTLEAGTESGLTASILFPTSLLLGSTTPIEAPASETPAADPVEITPGASAEVSSGQEGEAGQSDALAKLLGFNEEPTTPAEEETWTPPEVTPNAPLTSVSRQRQSDTKDEPAVLEEAIPSGEAFDNGVAALLRTDDAPADETVGLVKRTRGASPASPTPSSDARPVVATSRNPDEVRSMLSQYRDGLKGGREGGPSTTEDSDSNPENEASS